MSPASYRTAPPRVAMPMLLDRDGGVQIVARDSAEEVEGPGDLLPGLVVERHILPEAAGLEGAVGGGEVSLGLLQQRLRLRLILGVARRLLVVVPAVVARLVVARGWGRRADAGHVADRGHQGAADAGLAAVVDHHVPQREVRRAVALGARRIHRYDVHQPGLQ